MIAEAKAFIQKLLSPPDPEQCTRCGGWNTKKNGTRPIKLKDLSGVQEARHQNYYCHDCRKPYYVPNGLRGKWWHYTRPVRRKTLDMYVHLGGSWRRVTGWIRSEINHSERWPIWYILRQPPSGKRLQVFLSHTTCWRWSQEAGQRQRAKKNVYGDVPQSGALVGDSTGVPVRKESHSLLAVADPIKRVLFSLKRFVIEDEVGVEAHMRHLKDLGVQIERVWGFLSDGATAFKRMLETVLGRARHFRCIFHLWRNILPFIATYKAKAGEEAAKAFREAVKAVWNATELWVAQQRLYALVAQWYDEEILRPAIHIVLCTFDEAMAHLRYAGTGVGRTVNLIEWIWHRYKWRLGPLQCFMSDEGCDNFNALWEVYYNWEPAQKRKEKKKHYAYPGRSPLEVAGCEVSGLSWLDAVGV
jgi:transposase-like protein